MDQLTLFSEAPSSPASYVYVGVRGGQVKIGMTCNPERRARQLGITLLRVEAGGRELERTLHRRFRTARIDREWFMPTPDVLGYALAGTLCCLPGATSGRRVGRCDRASAVKPARPHHVTHRRGHHRSRPAGR